MFEFLAFLKSALGNVALAVISKDLQSGKYINCLKYIQLKQKNYHLTDHRGMLLTSIQAITACRSLQWL